MPLAVIVSVVTVLVVAALLLIWIRARQSDAHVVWRTMFGPAVVFTVEDDDGSPVRVLSVGGSFQSATYLDDDRCYELVFAYDKLYDRMFDAGIPIRRALMLGGGGYAYPKHFIATRPGAHMDVVEIDPMITSIAGRYFYLDRLVEEYDTETTGRLGLFNADGREFIDEMARGLDGTRDDGGAGGDEDFERYDAILNDSFSGDKPVASLSTPEAARAIQKCLVDGGIYMTNVVSAVEGRESAELQAVVKTLGAVFAHVWAIPCAGTDGFWDRDNIMVVASDGDYDFIGARELVSVSAASDGPDD